MALATVADLKKELAASQASWSVAEHLDDQAEIPQYALGIPEDYPKASEIKRTDLKKLLVEAPLNPSLAEPRARVGLMPKPGLKLLDETTRKSLSALVRNGAPAGGAPGRAATVDWRNRFERSWVTGIRDQNPCGSCWAFAVTALIESMVRIDHAVWCIRSEGDVHDGMAHTCAQGDWPQVALDWIKQHGLADPRCYPYYNFDHTWNPTQDRNGRTVKLEDYTMLANVEDEKNWIYSVGPVTCVFEVYTDFGGFGSGVYRKHANAVLRGLHAVELVGYDDGLQCWIGKNSWGTAFGDNGFFRIGYGECKIDDYPKIGLRATDPDPLTKRRLHNGNLLESGYGAFWHRNFEMVATLGNQAKHWWRDNSTGGFPWHAGPVFAGDVAACPTLTSTSYNRNLEIVYPTGSSRLHHWWRDEGTGQWHDGGVFGPIDTQGIPGFIQGSYNAPGNFEVVVRTQDARLNHWWRDGGGWHDGGRFATNVAFSGASLVQTTYGANGNLEVVCALNSGQMQHWWRDDDHGFVWHPGPVFGAGVHSPPCMIQGQYGMETSPNAMGNFELCVAVGGQVQHWWRNNGGAGGWMQSATFGHDVLAVAGLLEGSYGFNLEVIVLRTDRQLQHYWRDGAGWHEGAVIGAA
jgi:C1A family cysteine protease